MTNSSDVTVDCPVCGATFTRDADETWKKICLSCYRERKVVTPQAAPRAAPRAAPGTLYARLGRELAENRSALRNLCDPEYHLVASDYQQAIAMSRWLESVYQRIEGAEL